MKTSKHDQLKAAYALNLWTVSISQIIDYNDVNILEQEYNTIMNNLNLENMPKDEALLDVIKEILDEITKLRLDEGDRKIVEMEYQHQLRNAVWAAVPNVGAIFATSNPIAIGLTLATQVGIGYMNYRRNKAQNELNYEKSKWQLQRNRLQHLHGLQKQLFDTAWRLADTYEFPDQYRLTASQISEYNTALMESNPVRRYNNLNALRSSFDAYPAFWYQIGSTANSIFRNDKYTPDLEAKSRYRAYAIECFEKYRQLNQFNLLRHDILTSSWALEYLELMDMNQTHDFQEALSLIKTAEAYSGNALDVLELCAFAYLRVRDYKNAARLFHLLVNKDYNSAINTQILSGLYILSMHNGNSEQRANAKFEYRQLYNIADPKYILEMPPENMDLSQWDPSWNYEENKKESFDQFIQRQQEEKKRDEELKNEAKKEARPFYQRPILIAYQTGLEDEAEYFLGILNENRNKLDPSLPSPSRCKLSDYKRNREELERKGTHIIMLGDSNEAKTLYKNANNGRWDYYNLGMRFVTYGNKTVLLTRPLKNNQIDDLIKLAREVNEKHPIKIPDAQTVKCTFLKELFEGHFNEPTDAFATVLTSVLLSPLLVLGQTCEGIVNGMQSAQNLSVKKELDFLQYCIAIYQYLDSKKAIID